MLLKIWLVYEILKTSKVAITAKNDIRIVKGGNSGKDRIGCRAFQDAGGYDVASEVVSKAARMAGEIILGKLDKERGP